MGIEEVVAGLIIEADSCWAEDSCLSDVAVPSVVLSWCLKGHSLCRNMALIDSVDLVGNVIEDYCFLAGSERLLRHMPYIFKRFELRRSLCLIGSRRWRIMWWKVIVDLRMEHIGYWIGLRRIDGNHLYGFSFAVCAHSYVDWTSTTLQMLPYLIFLPRTSLHLLHVNFLLLSYNLRNSCFLPFSLILQW